jgi:hypothetical protein
MISASRFGLPKAALALCAVALFSAAASAQSFPGAGGVLPNSGAGTYPTTPGAVGVGYVDFPVAVTANVISVDKLTISGWTHTWLGDLQIALIDPNGVGHNIMVRPGFNSAGGFGNSGDRLGGVYEFVQSGGLQVPHTAATNMPAGTYNQDFGDPNTTIPFPSGTLNIFNTPMNTITGPLGAWNVRFYDWAGGDTGAITGVILDVNGAGAPPVTFCVAKVTANACVPAIGYTGVPSATTGSGFIVNGTNFINNKACLLFYGTTGQGNVPFQGGTLCVKTPIKRTPGTNTFGNVPPNDCSGAPAIDMNLFAVGGGGGTPLAALTVPGTVVDCQWWGRDPGFPAPNNTQLSNGLEYTVGP